MSALTPNFFLVGPPKCGTSSLFYWLADHPQVTTTSRKEPFVLMDEGHPLALGSTSEKKSSRLYDGLMDAASSHFPVRIDGTTHYFYQNAARRWLTDHPETRACVVLRNPADRALSSFRFTQQNLSRVGPKYDELDYVERVLSGGSVSPDICSDSRSAYVLDRDIVYGYYAQHLRAWFKAIGRDRVTVIRFDDLRSRPAQTIRSLAASLGIHPDFYSRYDFTPRNATVSIRFPRVHRLARRVAVALQGSGVLRTLAGRVYYRAQQAAPESRRDSGRFAEARAALIDHYTDHNMALEDLLDIDLRAWRGAS